MNQIPEVLAGSAARSTSPSGCVTHGLRKAASRRLAEAGCSANEIAAIAGHAKLIEVSRYTKAAEQRRLARTAIDRLSTGNGPVDSQTHLTGLGKIRKRSIISVSRKRLGAP